MTRKHQSAADPHEWLNRANSNLTHARDSDAGVCREDLCYDAQQAAEKAIKAVFVGCDERFPFIHDLADLLKLLERIGVKIPKYLWAVDELTDYAILTRYPGFQDAVTRREYRRAVRISESVVRWAERQVELSMKKRGVKT